jgi:hypothetical protein
MTKALFRADPKIVQSALSRMSWNDEGVVSGRSEDRSKL